MKRICLWSSPRNISTAIMYSFAQRKDTLVIDEPLYAHYLRVTGADHPGKKEVMLSQENDGNKVVRNVILCEYDYKVVFLKQMTHHLIELDESFLEKVINVFLIRDPKQLISSLAQVLQTVTMRDTGIKRQYELYKELEKKGISTVVVDSGGIIKNPESALKKFCASLEIPFDKNMLHWKTGGRKEDGLWSKYWYENVHKSTGFEKQKTSNRELPSELNQLYSECLPYYEFMRSVAIVR